MAVGQHTDMRTVFGPIPVIASALQILFALGGAPQRHEQGEFEGLSDLSALDSPEDVIAAFSKAYPTADTTRMHALDVDQFIFGICARPGKPVNFVPVVNGDVRRWFKSDSLWQAQNPNYTADQVLIIPGPEAVTIGAADEPITDLGTYEACVIRALGDSQIPSALRGIGNSENGRQAQYLLEQKRKMVRASVS